VTARTPSPPRTATISLAVGAVFLAACATSAPTAGLRLLAQADSVLALPLGAVTPEGTALVHRVYGRRPPASRGRDGLRPVDYAIAGTGFAALLALTVLFVTHTVEGVP
jgi:hypothetical protein